MGMCLGKYIFIIHGYNPHNGITLKYDGPLYDHIVNLTWTPVGNLLDEVYVDFVDPDGVLNNL